MPRLNKIWYEKPWQVEKADPTRLDYQPTARSVLWEDRDSEVLRDQLHAKFVMSMDFVDSIQMGDSIENNIIDNELELSTLIKKNLWCHNKPT